MRKLILLFDATGGRGGWRVVDEVTTTTTMMMMMMAQILPPTTFQSSIFTFISGLWYLVMFLSLVARE
jgi:hypothetical protein